MITREDFYNYFRDSVHSKINGVTPLIDPAKYRGTGEVMMAKASSIGDEIVSQRLDRFIASGLHRLEGEELTTVASWFGFFRKTDTISKVAIFIHGKPGCTVYSGYELLDANSGSWKTTDNIIINRYGYGVGVAEYDRIGKYVVENGELRPKETQANIKYASNTEQLVVGGAFESDYQLLKRIESGGIRNNPNDQMKRAIDELEGVYWSRYVNIANTCIGKGPMLVVKGGDTAEISNVVLQQSTNLNLIGETITTVNCTEIKIQRPCPVLIKVRAFENCDCVTDSVDDGVAEILSNAPLLTDRTSLSIRDLTTSEAFSRVELCIKRAPLVGCVSEGVNTIVDPDSGDSIKFGSNKIHGICRGYLDCGTCDWKTTITLQPWEYPVIDANYIEVFNDCSVEKLSCGCNRECNC